MLFDFIKILHLEFCWVKPTFNKRNRYVGNLDPQTISGGTGGDADVNGSYRL